MFINFYYRINKIKKYDKVAYLGAYQ
jgi:hypothetical protein